VFLFKLNAVYIAAEVKQLGLGKPDAAGVERDGIPMGWIGSRLHVPTLGGSAQHGTVVNLFQKSACTGKTNLLNF